MTSQSTNVAIAPAPRRKRDFLRRALTFLATRRSLRQQRLVLAEMEAHRLRDLGLDAMQARREALRPFWDGPAYWR